MSELSSSSGSRKAVSSTAPPMNMNDMDAWTNYYQYVKDTHVANVSIDKVIIIKVFSDYPPVYYGFIANEINGLKIQLNLKKKCICIHQDGKGSWYIDIYK